MRLAHEYFQRAGDQQEWLQYKFIRAQIIGQLLYQQIQYKAADQIYLHILIGKEKALRPDDISTLHTVNNLGILYRDQGKLAEAEQMYIQALAGYEKALQSENIPALRAACNLGVLYRDQGRMKEAKIMFQRAVLGREKLLGSSHPDTLEVVNYLKQLNM